MAEKERSYELKEAMSRLIVTQPFFAVVMLDLLKIVEVEGADAQRVPTAATDGRHLFINPKFFGPLNIEQRVGVLVHEVMHVILQHCPRMKLYMDRGFGPDLNPFNNKKWNYATDYIINDWVHSSGAGKIPVGGLFHPDFGKEDLADDVYLKIPEPPEDEGGNWDVHLPAADDAPSTADVQRAVAGAANAARNVGKMPAGMDRLVGELTNPQVHWADKLRMSIIRASGRDQNTWSKPHRRRLAVAPHVYWPGLTGIGAGTIVAYEDTSGSIQDAEIAGFRSEMGGIYEDVRPERMFIGSCDATAYEPTEVNDINDIVSHRAEGGGGTHMPAIFEKLEELDIVPDCLVILTDGYTDFGKQPPYEVIWVMTTDREAPYGTNIRIHVGQ